LDTKDGLFFTCWNSSLLELLAFINRLRFCEADEKSICAISANGTERNDGGNQEQGSDVHVN